MRKRNKIIKGKEMNNVFLIKSNGPNRLSGPVSAYSTTINSKSFNFYGDEHFNMENSCQPCKDINLTTGKITIPKGGKDCWDISVLLAETFTKYSKEGKYVDFYIELPYVPKTRLYPSKNSIDINSGYIAKLMNIFYNCLFKIECQYNTVRFHYIDVRLGYKKSDLKETYENIKNVGSGEQNVVKKEAVDYETIISMELVSLAINKFANKISTGNHDKDEFIEITNRLARDLYFDKKNYRLFELYLTSDDFINDVKNLLDWSEIKNPKFVNILNRSLSYVKQKDGKVMHKIRAQLYALEKEGQTDLARNIRNYILELYIENSKKNLNKLMDIWNSLYLTYIGFISGKYRNNEDMDRVKKAFQQGVTNAFKQEFNIFLDSASPGFSLILDAYLLARMFRKHKGNESSKIVVFAGDDHIGTCVKFFTMYLHLSTPMIVYNPSLGYFEKNDPVSRCLQVDIKDFT